MITLSNTVTDLLITPLIGIMIIIFDFIIYHFMALVIVNLLQKSKPLG